MRTKIEILKIVLIVIIYSWVVHERPGRALINIMINIYYIERDSNDPDSTIEVYLNAKEGSGQEVNDNRPSKINSNNNSFNMSFASFLLLPSINLTSE